jgi:hypothetical protein
MNKYGLVDLMERVGSISLTKADLYETHDNGYIDLLFECGKINKPITVPGESRERSL